MHYIVHILAPGGQGRSGDVLAGSPQWVDYLNQLHVEDCWAVPSLPVARCRAGSNYLHEMERPKVCSLITLYTTVTSYVISVVTRRGLVFFLSSYARSSRVKDHIPPSPPPLG